MRRRPGGSAAPRIDPRFFPGFSYLLGVPADRERSQLGADPGKARPLLEALHSLLPIGQSEENPGIPSGYTYLLQLIAHDLVETTVPLWVAADAGVPSRNMRGATLELDTLYGGGPTVCPMAFEPSGGIPDFRSQLRLGRVAETSPGASSGACPFRDLARLKMEARPPAPSNVGQVSQVYVADPRNDDNTIVSQLTVLFSILHNAIAGRLSNQPQQAQFAHARSAVLQMYYSVIRHDLLPRLLHPKVREILRERALSSTDWLWHGREVPLEFTHGAFRVGHAMVRPFYVFNDANTLPLSSVIGGPTVGHLDRDPLPQSWILQWSRFFELSGKPNYSLKLAVRQRVPIDGGSLLPDIAANTPEQLTLRDWLSSAAARLWRLDSFIDAVGQHYAGLNFLRSDGISQWLTSLLETTPGMADAKAVVRQNLDLLTGDLPLPLYILLESQLDPEIAGRHPGALGSILIGEVVYRRLAEGEQALKPAIPISKQAIGAADWNRIEAVTNMPALIRLAEDWGGLADCPDMPFIGASRQ